jgi:2-oxoisovalerate dehydrogenase E1 component
MAIFDALLPKSAWQEVRTEPSDWAAASPQLLASMLVSMHLVRAFEEQVLDLAGLGLVHGPAHSAIGQEGGAAGAMWALKPGDQINGSHRGHHQFLLKALSYLQPEGFATTSAFSEDVRGLVRKSVGEILGLSIGFCGGRGGSMHLRWEAAGNLGTNAIVGGGAPLALGAAFAHKMAGTDNVAFTHFGDGAINIGSVLESMNLAAAWKLPVCFFIENNFYAVATKVAEVTAEPRLSSRGAAFAIPSFRVDGMDPLAVYLATEEAASIMRRGEGPTIIEVEVYRYFHQNGPLPGSAFGYRSKDEEAQWRERDPLHRVAEEMQRRQLIGEAAVETLRRQCQVLMAEIADELTEETAGKRSIRSGLWPDKAFRDVGIRSDQSELEGMRTEELETFQGAIDVEAKFVDVIARTLSRRMQSDKSIILLGEDIHRLRGGTNGATKGLADEFPDRVLGTPICEAAFAGLAGGMAMDGRFKPIVEFMYPDFVWVAADQVFNQIGKARHMFGGDIAVPLVLRTKIAMGTGYGSQHSMDPAGIFATSPGWRIVAPATPFDYVGLMNTALLSQDPVLVIEHVDLYGSKGPAPADDLDYFIPFGKAKVVRAGEMMTVLTYSAMVRKSVDLVDELAIDAEVIDLRSLDRASIDWETIGISVRKTNKVLIVEQGALGTSYGGLLADEIHRRYFDWLDQPVQRVHGGEAAPSISKILESAAIAGASDIKPALERVLRESGYWPNPA